MKECRGLYCVNPWVLHGEEDFLGKDRLGMSLKKEDGSELLPQVLGCF